MKGRKLEKSINTYNSAVSRPDYFVNSRFGGKARFWQLDTIAGAIHVQTGKTTPIGRISLRENSVSRHHMGPETPQAITALWY